MDKKKMKMNLQFHAGPTGSTSFSPTPKSNSPVYTSTISDERRDIDVSSKIHRLVEDSSPFVALLMKAKKDKCTTSRIEWWDSKPGEWWAQTVGAVADSVSVIPVTDASPFREKDVVIVPATEEILYVTATDEESTQNTITVRREASGTTAKAIPDNSNLMRLGNAMEQFSSAPESKIAQPFMGWNVTQIFRTPFDMSETASKESLKTKENERHRLRKEKGMDHGLDMERAFIFNRRFQSPKAERQTAGGLLQFIGNRGIDMENKFSEEALEEYCKILFQFGKKKKFFMCSRTILSNINFIARDRIETTSGEETYGLRLKKYVSTFGDLILLPSQTLERDYEGLGIGVDFDYIRFMPFADRDTKLRTNIQANDADGWRDEYLTEATLEVRQPDLHAVMYNAAGREIY